MTDRQVIALLSIVAYAGGFFVMPPGPLYRKILAGVLIIIGAAIAKVGNEQ